MTSLRSNEFILSLIFVNEFKVNYKKYVLEWSQSKNLITSSYIIDLILLAKFY